MPLDGCTPWTIWAKHTIVLSFASREPQEMRMTRPRIMADVRDRKGRPSKRRTRKTISHNGGGLKLLSFRGGDYFYCERWQRDRLNPPQPTKQQATSCMTTVFLEAFPANILISHHCKLSILLVKVIPLDIQSFVLFPNVPCPCNLNITIPLFDMIKLYVSNDI